MTLSVDSTCVRNADDTRCDSRTTVVGGIRLALGRSKQLLAVTDDGNRVFVGSNGGRLSTLDIETRETTTRFVGHSGPVLAFALGPDALSAKPDSRMRDAGELAAGITKYLDTAGFQARTQ